EVGQPYERQQRVDELIVDRRSSQRVQAVSDLGRRQLAEIAVDVLHQVSEVAGAQIGNRVGHAVLVHLGIPLVGVGSGVAVHELAEIGVQVRALDQLPDLALQQRQLGR